MTQKKKLIEKFKKNPRSLSLKDLCKIMQWHDVEMIQGKGSHIIFRKDSLPLISIPKHNHDCKPFYKKEALDILLSHNILS